MATNLANKYRNGGKACRTGHVSWLNSFDRAAYRRRLRYAQISIDSKNKESWKLFARSEYVASRTINKLRGARHDELRNKVCG